MPPLRRSTRNASKMPTTTVEARNEKEASSPVVRSTPQKRKKTTPTAANTPPTRKIRLTDLSTSITSTAGTFSPTVVVDPAAGLDATTAKLAMHNTTVPYDAMLVLVEPLHNMDKFYVVQVIQDGKFHLYTRWGRTGTSGQAQLEDYNRKADAIQAFRTKFKSKTGTAWGNRDSTLQEAGKYRFVGHTQFGAKVALSDAAISDDAPQWQYWVEDGVDGKADGWYNYDPTGGAQVERLYREYAGNQNMDYLMVRTVASGQHKYAVDLKNMTQTNVTHPNRTERRIRRWTEKDDEKQDKSDPLTPTKKTVSRAATTMTTPSLTTQAAALTTPPPSTQNNKAAVVTPPTSVPVKPNRPSPPVDTSIVIVGQDPAVYHVALHAAGNPSHYDAVLNQCNIAGNNNKYYRLQLLQHASTGEYYVWFRWGRVGELAKTSASTWSGPYASLEGTAEKTFAKKYRDKTGNPFGAVTFTAKKGKYTPIQVDHTVEVTDAALDAASVSNQAASAKKTNVEYAPSKLDSVTRDLIQTLFSKDMRNEALASFQIDLKRLPLGVPSLVQIQSGVAVLKEIEDKLNGTPTNETFEELSSRFYTTIPHSFGRSRPPLIDNKESLQSRFDMCNILMDMYDTTETVRKMCNILMDMYDTTETVRKIEQEEQHQNTVLQKPNPVDLHYDSLHADLTVLDKLGSEFQTIRQSFEATKGQHATRTQLLNVWSVNRHDESERFAQHDSLDQRYLLWHGTNIAVAAPIITSGLRIMPHSGGRVGSGIYLANMQEKSSQYTSGYGAKYACMFLCEAPLGKQHLVTEDGPHASGLKEAPTGFDSVHAVGRKQPKKFTSLLMDGKQVRVATHGPEDGDSNSTFWHDELLVYRESQVRLRYVLTVKL